MVCFHVFMQIVFTFTISPFFCDGTGPELQPFPWTRVPLLCSGDDAPCTYVTLWSWLMDTPHLRVLVAPWPDAVL